MSAALVADSKTSHTPSFVSVLHSMYPVAYERIQKKTMPLLYPVLVYLLFVPTHFHFKCV